MPTGPCLNLCGIAPFSDTNKVIHIRTSAIRAQRCFLRFPSFPSTLSPTSTHQFRFFCTHTQTIPSYPHPTWKTCSLPPTAPCPATTPLNFHQSAAVAPNQYSLSIPIHSPLKALATVLLHKYPLRIVPPKRKLKLTVLLALPAHHTLF